MGSETYDLTAAEIEGAERERLRAQQLEHAPYFAGFQERVGRRIPVSRWCVRPG
ncbi:nitroreductase family deazaflavin-dependent oxidoreductase [Streptomyces sp. NBC_01707]|uniref:nitroreductase/quinone reductase family protein n=1 Tax=unclassified Streptomyces TaxID=2593676 RepID=UPI0029BC0ED8|nr:MULTISPECIES: nitroreductase/quinone reductase family protein [unclassified Streptomyces]MDX3771534.1 nitroreductase/quinone reductase family protein [Streptomyces sp. AK08-01B]MDX3821386.1 nitroreductase/quinone reductase family protein [Streptomyces sp. AK08-01A]